MPNLLSIFFENLAEEIDKVKVKDCKFFSEYKIQEQFTKT